MKNLAISLLHKPAVLLWKHKAKHQNAKLFRRYTLILLLKKTLCLWMWTPKVSLCNATHCRDYRKENIFGLTSCHFY